MYLSLLINKYFEGVACGSFFFDRTKNICYNINRVKRLKKVEDYFMADVICFYCNKKFDRTKEPYEIVYGKRYAHKECSDKVSELQSFLKQKMGQYYSYQKIRTHINKITKDEYELQDICDTMHWWYDVKKGDPSKSNGGIGIFSFVYPDYLIYKEGQQKKSLINKNKELNDFVDSIPIEVEIKPTPVKRPKIKLFNFE